MTPALSRRTLLAAVPLQVAALAGCVGSLPGAPESPDDCRNGATLIRASEVPPDERYDDADPIRVGELPDGEREILAEAVESGEYFECGTGSERLAAVIDRIRDHYRRRRREDADDVGFAYAVYRGEWYDLSAYSRDEDVTAG